MNIKNSIFDYIRYKQLNWYGHVQRMDEESFIRYRSFFFRFKDLISTYKYTLITEKSIGKYLKLMVNAWVWLKCQYHPKDLTSAQRLIYWYITVQRSGLAFQDIVSSSSSPLLLLLLLLLLITIIIIIIIIIIIHKIFFILSQL